MSIPQDLIMQAETIGAGMDAAQQQGIQIMTPQGKYSARALNAVVDVVNEIMPMFGEQVMMEQYTEDLTIMPQELVNALMAIMTVADQAGVPIDMEISSVVSDNDLAKLAALIKRLAQDKKLKDFLMKGTEEVTEEVEVESAPAPEGGMEVSDEELFSQRV
tara:strand:- start:1343 stop:1825 length:483 start_codon:yes stop_codon:yes gene_type:complete